MDLDTIRMILLMAGTAVLIVLLPVAARVYFRSRGPRWVVCPDTGRVAHVQLDAWHAAATAVPGPPGRYVVACSEWPANAGCTRKCMSGPAAR